MAFIPPLPSIIPCRTDRTAEALDRQGGRDRLKNIDRDMYGAASSGGIRGIETDGPVDELSALEGRLIIGSWRDSGRSRVAFDSSKDILIF